MMNRVRFGGMVILACSMLGVAGAAWIGDGGGSHERGPASAKLAGLAWMAGTWVRHEGGEVLEECWQAPLGDCMIGVFRWIKDGKVAFTELMTITVDEGTPVFRLRHFDRKLVPWEEKDAALTYPLMRLSEMEACFENPQRDKPRRFVYEKRGNDALIVRLEGADPNVKAKGFEFKRK